MARARAKSTGGGEPKERRRHMRVLLGAVYFVALSLLVVWEFRERLDVLGNECTLTDAEPRSAMYARPYHAFLAWASGESSSHVVALGIPGELEEVQQNLCLGRAYMADVVRAVVAQHAAELVVDKWYSAGACATEPQGTEALVGAVKAAGFPVVVAETTGAAEERVGGACLVKRKQLDFAALGATNVRHGLSRLDNETEHVPIRWLVLPESAEGGGEAAEGKAEGGRAKTEDVKAKPEAEDAMAWAAVKAYDPEFARGSRLQKLVREDQHPFANLRVDVPRGTTTQLLCAAAPAEVKARWHADCAGVGPPPNLVGKIVVVGSELEGDRRMVLGARMWGFDLQARYIEALLSGSYLRELPFWAAFGLFAAFIFVIEGLPSVLEAFFPQWRRRKFLARAYKRRRYVWTVVWAVLFAVGASVLALALRYLPPLAVLGDIAIVAVTRILLYAAESTEAPLIGHHHGATGSSSQRKGKVHSHV